jgi:hypothetical protein
MATTLVGFRGAKLDYLAEHAATLAVHDLGSSGFTWYGCFPAGAATFAVLARRHRLPLAPWPTIVLDRQHRVAAVFLRALHDTDLQPVVERIASESPAGAS